jgi:uncharacterized protein YcbK (DUF882 family)
MAFSSRTMRASDWRALRHFKASEFKYPHRMGYEFMRWLDDVRQTLGEPLSRSGDWRDPKSNAEVGGAKDSAHMDEICDAIDLSARGMTGAKRLRLFVVAYSLGCRRFGIYENGSVHLDRTEDRRPHAMWVKV